MQESNEGKKVIPVINFNNNSEGLSDIFNDKSADPLREIEPARIKKLIKRVKFFSLVKNTLIWYSKFQKGFMYVEPFFRILAYIYLIYHISK